MPCFRGIEILLFTVADNEPACLPEFPHPDGSSVKLGPQHADHDEKRRARSATRSGAPRNSPRISVYVPSQPNTKFFFDYTIIQVPPATLGAPEIKYFFFKILINGRHIVAWGIDLHKVTSGSAYRALYGPGRHYQHLSEDGKSVITQPGIEARYFWFLSNSECLGQNQAIKSVADDGGLIEVQVFRAKGRTGRTPVLDPYHNYDRYGVGVLSDGLVDKPEEADYYDYHLCDPKDSPYATFHFHYRSWQNLRQLQLVPQDEHQDLVSTFGKTLSSVDVGAAKPVWEELEEFGGSSHKEHQHVETLHSISTSTKRASTDTTIENESSVFDQSSFYGLASSITPRRNSVDIATCQLNNPPQLQPPTTAFFTNRIPEPSKSLCDIAASEFLLRRPLPELSPPDLASDTETRVSHVSMSISRRSSVSSRAPSITPSLLPYVDGESFFLESFEIGVAKGVELAQKDKEDKLWRRWSRKTTSMALPSEWRSSRSKTTPQLRHMVSDDSRNPVQDKLVITAGVSRSDYNTRSVTSATSFYQSERMQPLGFSSKPQNPQNLGVKEKTQMQVVLTPVQEERQRRDIDTAGVGKVSPKAKQLLGDELDFSSSNFAISPINRSNKNSIYSSGTISISESEWIDGSSLAAEGSERQRQPSTNFFTKLWSPRLKCHTSRSKFSPGERGGEMRTGS